MAVLRIYADEAGQKTLSDDEGPFVAATVSILGSPPALEEVVGRKEWLVERLVDLQAVPFYSMIIPYPGYGEKMRGKLEKMELLSRTNALVTGATKKYLGPDGFSFRNMIWVRAMQDAIPIAFLKGVSRGKVEQVEVVIDQQTLNSGMELMMRDLTEKMNDRLIGVIEKVRPVNPREADLLASQCPQGSNFLSIKVNNAPNPIEAEDGLKLAHYLASLTLKDLKKPRESSLASLLEEAGFSQFSQDITSWAEAPLSPDAVANWERMTGLIAPRD